VLGLWRRPRASRSEPTPVDGGGLEDSSELGTDTDAEELTKQITRRPSSRHDASSASEIDADEPTRPIG
jgi:hypothetical protein